ncbi:MAG: hypothetical protein M1833_002867 [Piccolia ochrophora]|nr:MAG: hypothetical protein M1833_002867 [Piccolia ochrophora]
MQKVLRRTALAKAHVAKRIANAAEKRAAAERKAKKFEHRSVAQEASQDVRDERRRRREDWDLGPLAPKRDVGDQTGTYGAMDGRRLKLKEIPREKRIRFWSIVPGDRVVIIDGKDKGKIGEVKTIDAKTNGLTVGGMNIVDVKVPDWMIDKDPDKRPTRTMEAQVPLSSVRLVTAVYNEETGQKKDMIVKEIALGNVWYDRHTSSQRFHRYIAGQGTSIPWPRKTPKEHKDNDADTLRIDVESRTFMPTLLRPPIPVSVMDELRNKYSAFRDRHDEEFIAKKQAQDEAKVEKNRMSFRMRTPLNEVPRRVKRLGPRPAKLTGDMLVRIGEMVARKKGSPDIKHTEAAAA